MWRCYYLNSGHSDITSNLLKYMDFTNRMTCSVGGVRQVTENLKKSTEIGKNVRYIFVT
jgi:hypothetical protein